MAAGGHDRTLMARASVAGRIVLAVGGGYGVAALATALLSLALPLPRAEAVSAAMVVSFALMGAVVMLVFSTRTLRSAAVIVAAVAAGLGGGLWLALSLHPGSAS